MLYQGVEMTKAEEFAAAMDRYTGSAFYGWFGLVVSGAVLTMQAFSAARVEWSALSPVYLAYFVVAYIVTDFINGAVHMWMDNNDDYTSPAGPLIAAFHLHHLKPRYTDHNPLVVYALESGSKNWLVVYLIGLIVAQPFIPAGLNFTLVAIGILSSWAEVSHFLCHNGEGRVVRWMQRFRILLPVEHHAEHHARDNYNYAVLNGLSDPVLNWLAIRMYSGYVNGTDLHVKSYSGPLNANRRG